MTSERSIEASPVPSSVRSVPSFEAVADELYANPPHMFAALRAERAEQARAAGSADVARRIEKLRVPSAAAWMSNQLVRYFRDEVLVLLDLGRALQVATGALDQGTLDQGALAASTVDADAVRRLDDRRREVYSELHRQAVWLAVEERVTAGRPVLRGLGDSLHSAMCSERMAQEMLTGRLVRSLPRISWPGLTPDCFPDELARRRALRVARTIETRENATDTRDATLATVTSPFARRR